MYLFFYSSWLEFSNKTRSMDGRSRSNILFVRRRIWRSSSIRKLQQIWKRLLSRLSSYLSRQFIYQFLFWICHFLLPWVHVSLPKQAHWRSRRSRPRPCFWSVSRGYRNSARISNMVLFILHHNDHAWNGQCCNNLQFFSQRERIFQIFKKKTCNGTFRWEVLSASSLDSWTNSNLLSIAGESQGKSSLAWLLVSHF